MSIDKGNLLPPNFSNSSLELKIPPVLVVISVAALMWWVAVVAAPFGFFLPARGVLAACAAVLGVTVCVMGIVEFRRAGTTVNPLKPSQSSSLVVSGIYRLTRNPMYLGFLLCLAGWALLLSNVLAFVFLPIFVLYLNRFQILPEERALATLYGEQFTAYRERVRRWL
jgi:protein-S-isoprenylcysteine O-methyltransferase Ste14